MKTMSREYLIQKFNEATINKRLLLIEQDYARHELYLAIQEQYNFVYIQGHSLLGKDLDTFLKTINLEFQHQYPEQSPEFKSLTDLANFINQQSNFVLHISQYDLATSPKLNAILHDLSQQLTKHHSILIASSPIALHLYKNINPLVTVFDLTTHTSSNLEPTSHEFQTLQVYALGSPRAYVNGHPIVQWDGNLPRALFFYFIHHGMANRTNIFQTFWPGLSTADATNVFHVTKSKMHEKLDMRFIAFSGGFYRLITDMSLYYDVSQFKEAMQNADIAETDEERIKYYEDAIKIYRGPFLASLDYDWVKVQRDHLEGSYIDALVRIGMIYLTQTDYEKALKYFLRAFALTPRREDIIALILSIYADWNEQTAATRIFDRYKKAIIQPPAIEIPSHIQDAYNQIMKHNPDGD